MLQCTRNVMNAASMQLPYQTYVSKHTKRSDKVFAAASGLKLYICKMQIYKAFSYCIESNGIDAVTHSVNLLLFSGGKCRSEAVRNKKELETCKDLHVSPKCKSCQRTEVVHQFHQMKLCDKVQRAAPNGEPEGTGKRGSHEGGEMEICGLACQSCRKEILRRNESFHLVANGVCSSQRLR